MVFPVELRLKNVELDAALDELVAARVKLVEEELMLLLFELNDALLVL